MRRSMLLAASVITAAVVIAGGSALFPDATPEPPPAGVGAHAGEAELADGGVTVEAIGTVEGTPDVLVAEIGVQVEASSVQEAYARANTAAAEVRDVLVDRGIADEDLQTAQLRLGPSHRPGPEGEREQASYRAATSLRAELRDLDAAGSIIDDAVGAAGDAATLRSLGFSLDDDAALVVDARQAAFTEARAKAEQYAELAGRSLGELRGLAEADSPARRPPEPLHDAVAMEAEDAAPPIEPGAEEVVVRVRATWALQ